MAKHLSSYSKIYTLGHRATNELKDVLCYWEEKVDGSQFSFALDKDQDGVLHMRSKGAIIQPTEPPKLFAKAVDTVLGLRDSLTPGWTYRAEAVTSRKHNVLTYERIPEGGLIIYDIDTGDQNLLDPESRNHEVARLGLEAVPVLDMCEPDMEGLEYLVTNRESCLGGPKIEGVVMKPVDPVYDMATSKVLMAKYVSAAFKEQHTAAWKVPTKASLINQVAERFCPPARYQKAVQRLEETGERTFEPKDIGPLMKLVSQDLEEECKEEIKDYLYAHHRKSILKAATRALPQWYKDMLMKEQVKDWSSDV